MNIKMVTKHQIEDPWYHLTGWYEVEMGAGLVDVYGKSLEDCVRKLVAKDLDFGHTDCELEGGYLVADYDVSDAAMSIAKRNLMNQLG